jgi:hypothetical protein
MSRLILVLLANLCCLSSWASEIKIGLIGLDTPHVTDFTELINNPNAKGYVPGARVVAGYKGGSADIPISIQSVEGYTKTLGEKYDVKIYNTIEELCNNVDAVMIESIDGRTHLAQARIVIAEKKPLFIDKPMAGSLNEAIEIFRLAESSAVPIFSSSSLRFAKNTQAVAQGSIGKVLGAETMSPAHLEKTHPDLFWYGIHGCESLFTVMGTGCESVQRRTTTDGKIEVVGVWNGKRTGIFRESKTYGGSARGENGEAAIGAFDGYAPLIVEIVKFFQTKRPPVSAAETIEILAFMEAADESKQQDGKVILLSEILKRAAKPSTK